MLFRSPSKPSKGIAFTTSQEEPQDSDCDSDDLSQEEISFFAKRYKKFMKSKQVKPFTKNSSTGYKKEQKSGLDDKGKLENNMDSRGVQCHECSGYGHIKSECANTIKKKNIKGYQVAWDDDSDDSSTKSEIAHFTALMAGSYSHDISSHHSSVELDDTLSS